MVQHKLGFLNCPKAQVIRVKENKHSSCQMVGLVGINSLFYFEQNLGSQWHPLKLQYCHVFAINWLPMDTRNINKFVLWNDPTIDGRISRGLLVSLFVGAVKGKIHRGHQRFSGIASVLSVSAFMLPQNEPSSQSWVPGRGKCLLKLDLLWQAYEGLVAHF